MGYVDGGGYQRGERQNAFREKLETKHAIKVLEDYSKLAKYINMCEAGETVDMGEWTVARYSRAKQ